MFEEIVIDESRQIAGRAKFNGRKILEIDPLPLIDVRYHYFLKRLFLERRAVLSRIDVLSTPNSDLNGLVPEISQPNKWILAASIKTKTTRRDKGALGHFQLLFRRRALVNSRVQKAQREQGYEDSSDSRHSSVVLVGEVEEPTKQRMYKRAEYENEYQEYQQSREPYLGPRYHVGWNIGWDSWSHP